MRGVSPDSRPSAPPNPPSYSKLLDKATPVTAAPSPLSSSGAQSSQYDRDQATKRLEKLKQNRQWQWTSGNGNGSSTSIVSDHSSRSMPIEKVKVSPERERNWK